MERLSNINLLLAFATVAQEGSVSRAAERLNLTQPAVSHQLKRLAEETGTQLFRRTGTGLELTREGAALVPRAERVLEAMSEFTRGAQQQAGRIAGRLRIGTILDPDFIRLGPLLQALRADYPDVATELSHAVSGETLARLMRGQIDGGFFLNGPEIPKPRTEDDRLHVMWLADFTYRVIAPPGWQSRVESADWPALAEMPWIGTPPASAHHGLLGAIFARHGVRQRVVAEVDQEASMLEMVRAGVGLSLSRESIALHQRQTAGLSVAEAVSVPASLGFITLQRHLAQPTVEVVMDALRRTWFGG